MLKAKITSKIGTSLEWELPANIQCIILFCPVIALMQAICASPLGVTPRGLALQFTVPFSQSI